MVLSISHDLLGIRKEITSATRQMRCVLIATAEQKSSSSVVLPRVFAVLLNIFRLLFIDACHGVAGHTVGVKKLVELGLDR